jgi:exonuclease SbcD
MRNRLLAREEHQGKTIAELEEALRAAVADILADLAQQARAHDMPRLLAGHLSIAEAKLGSERTILLGRDLSLPTSAFADTAWDYVALGHIHRHQDLHPGAHPPVVYSGSLERIDFGEEEESKGFCWVELGRGSTRWEFVPVAARPFRTIRVDVRDADDPTLAVLRALEDREVGGAIVRIVIRLKADQESLLREREIEDGAESADTVTIVREVETEDRIRLGDLAPEALTPQQLVARYFQSMGVEGERLDSLLKKAGEILEGGD